MNQGIGIAEEHLLRFCPPFFPAKEKGTGVRLTFAQKIVELHRGEITAANRVGGGMTFTIELPMHGAEKGK